LRSDRGVLKLRLMRGGGNESLIQNPAPGNEEKKGGKAGGDAKSSRKSGHSRVGNRDGAKGWSDEELGVKHGLGGREKGAAGRGGRGEGGFLGTGGGRCMGKSRKRVLGACTGGGLRCSSGAKEKGKVPGGSKAYMAHLFLVGERGGGWVGVYPRDGEGYKREGGILRKS